LPVVQQQEAVGHAVRGGYYYASVADVAALTADSGADRGPYKRSEYIAAIDRIWQDVVGRKLYLTGSVGQHGAGEGYAGPYKLTNRKAYNETCASIALALWNHRMFLLHGDAKYIDVLERSLYNGVISGVALSGDRFFYPNPLECDLKFRFNQGSLERSRWFGTSCCPSNIARFIPSIPGYVYATQNRDLYVNLFVAGKAVIGLDGDDVELVQTTDYPWSGSVRFSVSPHQRRQFALRIRIPGWARGEVLPSDLYHFADDVNSQWTVDVNGQRIQPELESGYVVLDREWKSGDEIELTLPMPIRRVAANERVEPDRGRVAFQRGPLVYCVEGADHDGRVLDTWISDDAQFDAVHRDQLLGGVTVLRGKANAAFRANDDTVQSRPRQLTMIPYYAWCHRGPNEMSVWLPRSPDLAVVAPPATVASTSKVTASHCWHLDSVSATNDQVEPASSIDHDIARLTWWDHRGTKEWVQYEFTEPTRVESADVYWFDDTGRGQCRTPQSWKLLFRDAGKWKPVEPINDYGVAKNRYNQLRFRPVTTDALRIEVQLRDGFSAGILEWTVGVGSSKPPQLQD
jgi:DUF1680 family protein